MPSIHLKDVRLEYLDEGSGPPVVLLHAFPLSSAMWKAQVEHLASSHRVVAPDLRGFGGSDAPEDPASYSMGAFAGDVVGLLEHLGCGPSVVCGLSMGGYVAFELLRRHRGLLRAVVLADTRASSDPPEGIERRTSQQEQVRRGEVAPLLDNLIGGLLAPATHEGRPEVVSQVRAIMETASPQGIIGALEAMKRRGDATAELGGIDLAALWIVGEDDALSPPDVARQAVASLPDAGLDVIPGAGHLSNVEQPDRFNQSLTAFLDRIGA